MENETLQSCPVKLTDGAYAEIQKILEDQAIPEGHGLKIGVKGGGCSGFSYLLGFEAKSENDQEYCYQDIKIFMEPAHGLYITGMEIDFMDGLNNRGFVFNNPNASETCGCGTSFSA